MIRAIHWDNVPPSVAPAWFSSDDQVVAIWPSPVDHDLCFREAGFDEFDDSDDRWDADFETVCERLVGFLENTFCPPVVRSENDFVEPRDPTFLQRMLVPTSDDRFHDFVADFGPCRLRTGMGHPVFWLSWPKTTELSLVDILSAIGQGIPTTDRQLDWTRMVPGHPT